MKFAGVVDVFLARILGLSLPVAMLAIPGSAQALHPRLYAVEVSATVQTNPAQVRLTWRGDSEAKSYTIYRKALGSSSWGPGTTLAAGAVSYTDANVQIGSAYEYQLFKEAGSTYYGYGYIYAGVNAALTENRGKIILLVDNTVSSTLAPELSRLQQDLVGDGWTVLRHDVPRDASPPAVKSVILQDYNADRATVKSLFLFGHIPVAYSGDFAADGHLQHQGAWPADVYYGDMDGLWTDSSVNTTNAEREVNWNIPGDGKFDQSELPSDVELQVGRVDLSNMTCYSNQTPPRNEVDLLRQYLNKDHNFRHRITRVATRGLVADGMGDNQGLRVGVNAWRNYSALIGSENVVEAEPVDYVKATSSQQFLWTFAAAGGGFFVSEPIGDSNIFATNDIQAVFTTFVGSYFGDWDNESNFLRAPLGSTYGLTASYTGLPYWFYHHMGLGFPIGYSTLISQNNRTGGTYSVQVQGTRGVHIALMGDPTLRLHPVPPPGNVAGQSAGPVVSLSWTPASDTNVMGYHVYRANDPTGPFTRVSGTDPVAEKFFADAPGSLGTYTYMVRTVKLEQCPSGSYFNPSQGVFATVTVSSLQQQIPRSPNNLRATAFSSREIQLDWVDHADDETGFRIERRTETGVFAEIARTGANASSYNDTNLVSATGYIYRVRAYNNAGASDYSNEASASTPDPAAPVMSGALYVSGQFQMQVTGESGQRFCIDSSADLISWTPGNTNTFSSTPFSFGDSTGNPRKFYRARVVP